MNSRIKRIITDGVVYFIFTSYFLLETELDILSYCVLIAFGWWSFYDGYTRKKKFEIE